MNIILEKFLSSKDLSAKILFEHILFGKQVYKVEHLKPIIEEDKVGVCIANSTIYLYKKDLKLCKMYDNMFVFADDMNTITVIVNNL